MKRTRANVDGSPPPKVHASIMYSFVKDGQVMEASRTACNRDDVDLTTTIEIDLVTCGTCLGWIQANTVEKPEKEHGR